MGGAMLSAILDKDLARPEDIVVSDINGARLEHLGQEYGIAVMSDNKQAIDKGDVVIFAIKPQNLAGVMAELNGKLKPAQVVLSIIAGARIETLHRGLNHSCVVRAMPNTPAQIGEGMTVWTATAEVTGQQKGWIGSILGAMGKEIYAGDEGFIDMATAVSGSGPAYIFLIVEALVDAAVNIGLPVDMAYELVIQTILGSIHFAQKSGRTPLELRKMVTSPGGTTAAALLKLEEGNFTGLLIQAVTAAYNRAKELGR